MEHNKFVFLLKVYRKILEHKNPIITVMQRPTLDFIQMKTMPQELRCILENCDLCPAHTLLDSLHIRLLFAQDSHCVQTAPSESDAHFYIVKALLSEDEVQEIAKCIRLVWCSF